MINMVNRIFPLEIEASQKANVAKVVDMELWPFEPQKPTKHEKPRYGERLTIGWKPRRCL
jgi:hypothetical protein